MKIGFRPVPRQIPRAEAIAIQLVNLAAKGDPKGLAAVMTMTKEYDEAAAETQKVALDRPEDMEVLEGIITRLRARDTSSPLEASEPLSGTLDVDASPFNPSATTTVSRTDAAPGSPKRIRLPRKGV